jgi:hypothetical protein
MCALLETLVVAAYVFADSLSFPRPRPAGTVTGQKLIAHGGRAGGDRLLLRPPVPGDHWPAAARVLPTLPGQSQYNRRLRRLTPQITTVQRMVSEPIAAVG